jgi:hypothetical protein
MMEDTLCIEPGLSWYEGNEDFLYKLATSSTNSIPQTRRQAGITKEIAEKIWTRRRKGIWDVVK